MEEFKKRVKSGAWVALAGAIVAVIGVAMDSISLIGLTDSQQAIITIVGTAVVSQITKYLNK